MNRFEWLGMLVDAVDVEWYIWPVFHGLLGCRVKDVGSSFDLEQ